ncbi:MAG TPA: flagellin modification protein A, partial [Bacteroidia bacterium]|nr:flagellin modification protein A [Bacteroidia bacterium]
MLNNQVVVITGGAGLIGKEFVKAVIENNGIAVIADI